MGQGVNIYNNGLSALTWHIKIENHNHHSGEERYMLVYPA